MHRSRSVVPSTLAALLLLGACGGETTTEPTVVRVEVTPTSATLNAAGATQAFTARAVDGRGDPVPGQSVSWSTDDPGVATISSGGVATAVATGVTAVSATASGVTGTAQLTVLLPAEDCVSPTAVSLAVGEHQVFSSQECFVLPSGADGDRYRVVVARPDSSGAGDVVEATLTATARGATTAPGARTAAVRGAPAERAGPTLDAATLRELERALDVSERTRARHDALRRSEERMVAELGGRIRLATPPPSPAPGMARAAVQAPQKIRVDPRTSCSAGAREEDTGILVYESADLAIYQDSAQQKSAPITRDQASRLAQYYAAHGKEVVEAYFGVPTDLDGNGHMVVFVTPEVDDDKVAAYVWSGDFLDRAGESCPTANGGEYIFFNGSQIRRLDDGGYQALETLVHEAKHVVSLYNRLQASLEVGSGRFHPLWVEEGTAEIAGNLSSRTAMASKGIVGLGEKLTRDDFTDGEGRLGATPENFGVLLRMLRTVRYLSSQPNGLVVNPQGSHPDHSIYGTGWHFHRWLGDAWGNAASAGADASLFRALVAQDTPPGTAGLQAVVGRSFKELFRQYVLAIALHETGAPEGSRTFTSYDFPSATDILCRPGSGEGCPPGVSPQPDGVYPWPVTEGSDEPGTTVPASFASGVWSGPIGPTGIRIHDFRSDGLGEGLQVEVSMGAPGDVVVVRLR